MDLALKRKAAQAALRKEACTEAFEDVKLLIYDQVHKFRRQYGGSFEDLKSEAFEYYMLAFETWKKEKGPFIHWVKWVVSKTLLEMARRSAIKKARLARVPLDLSFVPEPKKFNSKEFLEGLSPDAQMVADLVYNPVMEIELNIAQKGNTPRQWRNALHEFLEDLGWSFDRITESFSEIAEAL